MPIQPGLALQVKGLDLPDPLAMQAQATQIQNALQQQRMGEMQMQNAMREQRRAQELESIMSGVAPNAPAADVAGRLQKGGFFQQAGQVLQQEATRQKTAREEELAKLNVISKKAELMGRLFVGVKDQQSYSMARQQAIQRGFGTEQDIPEAYDQATVDNVVKGSIAVIDSVKNQLKEREVGARETSAQAAASQARSAEERVEIARQAESTAQRRLDVEQRRLDSTERRLTNEERRLALAEENARLAQDPEHQRAMAAARAAGQAVARSEQAAIDVLPKVIDTAAAALANIDAMIGSPERKDPVTGKVIPATKPHPGFTTVVGATMLPGARFVPGTSAADFQARFDQIKGSAFLQAYETLKGGGQITNIEGEKGTAALNRMSIAQSEQEFIQAAREFQEVVQKGLERAQRRTQELRSGSPRGAAPSGPQPPAAAVQSLLRGEGTDEQFDAVFGPGAAARARGR